MSSPNLPWKLRLILRLIPFLFHILLRPNFTVNRWISRLIDRKSPPSPKPVDGVSSSDAIIDASRNLWIRIFTPTDGDEAPSRPVVIYFHGGGFALGDVDSVSMDTAARRLARGLRAVLVSVNYRLAPEHRCPSQYEDGFDAVKFLDESDEGILPENADLRRCFIVGESAGGNLGHHVAVRAAEYEFRKVKVVGLVATQPFFGGEERTEAEMRLSRQPPLTVEISDWFWKAFLPEGSDRDHGAANVFGENGVEIREFPAAVVFIGGFDPLQEWQRRYCEGLRKAGKKVEVVELPNAIHGFFGFPELQETVLMMKEMTEFIASTP